MRFLAETSIRKKLTRIIMLISSVALILSTILFVISDLFVMHQAILSELKIRTQVVGGNAAASLEFDAPAEGRKILSVLNADPRIMMTVLYNQNGALFAYYKRDDVAESAIPALRQTAEALAADRSLKIFRPIILDNAEVGAIFIQSDMGQLYDSLKNFGYIAALALAVSLGIAFAMSTWLRQAVSDPVTQLAATAERVSAQKDYSIRAVKHSGDELGLLVEKFNEMLGQIQHHEAELIKSRDRLEDAVKERTRELQHEVVERQQAEERLKIYAAELERSNEALKGFAAITSHDLQEPLRKIITFSDRLKNYAAILDERGLDYLTRLQSSAMRMQQFIRELLDYSKLSTQPRQNKPVDLNDLLAEVTTDLESRISSSNAALEIGRLPVIECDRLRIRQLFLNLISNALKFQQKDMPPQVKVTCRAPSPGAWEIAVRDNGIGFDVKYVDRIFMPFQRLHGRHQYEGSGMGLTICRKIVEQHGGSIAVESSPGNGAVFIVTLPEKAAGGQA